MVSREWMVFWDLFFRGNFASWNGGSTHILLGWRRCRWLRLGRLGLLVVSTFATTRRSCNGDERIRHDSQ